jgi:hypothetical protein
MQSSASLPPHTSSSRHLFTTSASVQSQLSALTSAAQPRRPLRLEVSGNPSKLPPPYIHVCPPSPDARASVGGGGGASYVPCLGVSTRSGTTLKAKAARGLPALLMKLVLLAYCGYSTFAFSAWTMGWDISRTAVSLPVAAPVAMLIPQLLPPKTTSIYPPPFALNTIVLHTGTSTFTNISKDRNAENLTACLWTNDTDIKLLPAWATRWQGSISLLVVTQLKPPSEEYKTLVHRLIAHSQNTQGSISLDTLPSPESSTHNITIHILTAYPTSYLTPNAYLNLALLLSLKTQASSSHILFPASLASPPSLHAHASLRAHVETSTAPALLVDSISKQDPSVNTSTSFAPSPLAPLLLPPARDNGEQAWCLERLIPPVGRAEDWDECLFEMWLKYFGRITKVAVGSNGDPRAEDMNARAGNARAGPCAPDEERRSTMNKHLALRQREEVCVLAAKRLVSLREAEEVHTESWSEKRALKDEEAVWLKKACKDVLDGWGKGLL